MTSRWTQAGPADAEELSRLAAAIWPEAYAGLLSVAQIDVMLARMYDPEQIRQSMGRGVHWRFLDDQDRHCGFVSWRIEAPILYLDKLYLHADVRGRGLARAAIEELVAVSRRHGCQHLQLRVNRHNARAIAVYQKLGFGILRADCAEIGQGFVMDDWIMERPLDGAV